MVRISAGVGTPLSNHRQELFCQLFVFGKPGAEGEGGDSGASPDTRNNATQAYLAAGYRPKNTSVAAALASRLLRNEKVSRRIAELRGHQEGFVDAYVQRWGSLLPDAQQVLVDAMEGKDVTTTQLRAALAVIDRAQGRTPSRRGPSRRTGETPIVNVTMWGGKKAVEEAP